MYHHQRSSQLGGKLNDSFKLTCAIPIPMTSQVDVGWVDSTSTLFGMASILVQGASAYDGRYSSFPLKPLYRVFEPRPLFPLNHCIAYLNLDDADVSDLNYCGNRPAIE